MPNRTDPYAGPSALGRLAGSYLIGGLGGLRSPADRPSSVAQLATAVAFTWRHRALALALVVTVTLWMVAGFLGLIGLVAGAASLAAGLVWWRPSLGRWAIERAYRAWRVATIYRPLWQDSMFALGLGRIDQAGRERFPRYRHVTSTAYGDRLLVKLPTGQVPEMLSLRAEGIAHSLGADSCRVARTGKPAWVTVYLRRGDSLVDVIPAIDPAPAGQLDLSRLHIGTTEDGEPWTVSLTGGSNVLIAGATGAGKGSVQMSLIRALGPAIAAGLVQVWGIDPKGGMELGPAAGLLHRFAYPVPAEDGTSLDYSPISALLDEAVWTMLRREDELRASGVRKFTPSIEHPAIVLFVDEVAALTRYITEAGFSKRAVAALSMLLTQGRAPGLSACMSVQDPRKESLPFRDLISTRVALRLTEPGQADLVLGDNAHKRGARCDEIPHGLPGVAYVQVEGSSELVRARAANVTDDDIARMVRDFAPPAPAELLAALGTPGAGAGDVPADAELVTVEGVAR